MFELVFMLSAAVFAVLNIVKRQYPKVQGWYGVAAALILSAVGVYVFGINGFAALPEADLDAWVEDLMTILTAFTTSGAINKMWSKLSYTTAPAIPVPTGVVEPPAVPNAVKELETPLA